VEKRFKAKSGKRSLKEIPNEGLKEGNRRVTVSRYCGGTSERRVGRKTRLKKLGGLSQRDGRIDVVRRGHNGQKKSNFLLEKEPRG